MTRKTKLAEYLEKLRENLSPLPENDIEEILNEIESLALATLEEGGGGGDIDSVLGELGSPKTLASQYKAHIHHGARLPLAVTLARRTARGASRTFRWFVTGLGFLIGLGFIVTGLLKPFLPDIIGFWVGGGGVIIGYPGASTGYDDILGYWIMPLAFLAGVGVFYLTLKVNRHLK